MKFTALESHMISKGINTLADIARALDTTPQAVSNWKARDQVPYHIVAKIRRKETSQNIFPGESNPKQPIVRYKEENLKLTDILITLAEQIKVILLIPFIFCFLQFTYVQFVEEPIYVSWASILLPDNNSTNNMSGLAGIANQFGVNMQNTQATDLSSPILLPKLLYSRTFAEKILDKSFYTDKFRKKLPLLSILTHGDEAPSAGKDTLISQAMAEFASLVSFDQEDTFSILKVESGEAVFSRDLALAVLNELESLNRFYKSQNVREKTKFIEQRISSVKNDLHDSENKLKIFREQNRQINSPALRLDEEQITRETEIQKGIFLTLKQQLELSKIEEVQEASIMQILDEPQIPLVPKSKKLKIRIFTALGIGLLMGILVGFSRDYFKTSNIEERKKFRRIRRFINQKGNDFILDYRISGIVSLMLIIGLPYYLGHKSKFPVYFGLYSQKAMLVNIFYLTFLTLSIILFLKSIIKMKKAKKIGYQ